MPLFFVSNFILYLNAKDNKIIKLLFTSTVMKKIILTIEFLVQVIILIAVSEMDK
ncbi:uncharacterized protein BX663DRAFT_505684 [Cokeromyces recurvatus]|uniref:uncharacterized protein n=1 Tax=Cokeromyces recurvatus TaxID=90255 RepID=UPI00221F564D|nr:uncharacterized protein BX663DRAFT_505684 [Cokeromyces recurvatus]KAI7903917.1 hypothetical protein BX663DRAFT_505684 [Cokeromyces recurvatus]